MLLCTPAKEHPLLDDTLRSSILMLSVLALGLAAPTAALAKGKGKSCASAEALFQETGAGDSDGDGLTDCRERRQLRTLLDDADTDDDSVADGEEIEERCDPRDPDSDDDGIDDGNDETPGLPEQKVEAFVEALTCPQLGVLGSITALGITVTLDDHTEFEDLACSEIAAQLALPESRVFAEIEILEDATGALTAREVEIEEGEHHDGHDEDTDEDD